MTERRDRGGLVEESFLADQRVLLNDALATQRRSAAALVGDRAGNGVGTAGEGEDLDEGERSQRLVERVNADSLAQQLGGHIDEIEAALRRLDDGTYGRCESCGDVIDRARLEALPEVTLCAACKRVSVDPLRRWA